MGVMIGVDKDNILREVAIDFVTSGQEVITTDHAAIHKKWGYSISGIFANVANGATVNYAFKTPTLASGKIIHLKVKEFYAVGNNIRADLYEAPTNAPTLGTDLSAYNHNRISPIPPTKMQAIKSGMTLDLTGATMIESLLFGNSSTARSSDLERDLAPDTWYIRTFTNGTGGVASINFFEFWYEEDMA